MGALTKVFGSNYIPAVVGRPAVPGTPARTVCTPKPAPGEWRYVCTRTPVSSQSISDGATLIPPGGQLVIEYDPNGAIDPVTGQVKVIGMYIEVCTSRWVTTGPAGPPVCVSYPAIPAQPEIPSSPARVETVPIREWDAGADSVVTQAGDCIVTFSMGMVSGVVVGLEHIDSYTVGKERALYGLYFAGRQFQVIESGITRTTPENFTSGDQFEILRYEGRIMYRHNGRLVFTSYTIDNEELQVCTSLYASGDYIE